MGKLTYDCLLWLSFFFSSLVKQINAGYPSLFPKPDEEDLQEGEGSSKEGGDNESDGADEVNSFSGKWGWVIWISQVSHEMGISWFDVYKTQVVVFLNVVCFLIDKSNEEKRQIEQWKKKH